MDKPLRIGLVDGDMIAFSCAAAHEYGKEDDDPSINFNHIQMTMDSKLEYLKRRLQLDVMHVFLSGKNNFRFKINPEYKANRAEVWRPFNLDNAKAHLRTCWNAMVMNGLEADDLIACFARYNYQVELGKHNKIRCFTGFERWPEGTQIFVCSLDKDLKQIPSINYRWETNGKGEKQEKIEGFGELHIIVKGTPKPGKSPVREVKGIGTKFFLWQLLTGDPTDGIIGCGRQTEMVYKSGQKVGETYFKRKGIGSMEAYELLKDCDNYKEGMQVVIAQYQRIFGEEWKEALVKAGRQLYMVNTIHNNKALMWHFDGTREYYDFSSQELLLNEVLQAA